MTQDYKRQQEQARIANQNHLREMQRIGEYSLKLAQEQRARIDALTRPKK